MLMAGELARMQLQADMIAQALSGGSRREAEDPAAARAAALARARGADPEPSTPVDSISPEVDDFFASAGVATTRI
jgi:hypothetical protein